ncbi:nucleotidyltransferase family protein [Sphingomonas corticis]|uniref:nucleotidyltransferase domain-containing protein n=1 Tax=Sphingomonas corticis TaxID=2722791 RepID=UPI003B8362FB
MRAIERLTELLAHPTGPVPDDAWTALLCVARAEQLSGALAHRLAGVAVPAPVAPLLAEARGAAAEQRRAALFEAEMARRALAPLGVPVLLLKGTAYVAAGLSAGRGRAIGDLDVLVPREALGAVEAALRAAGWRDVKDDGYDDAYYRRWMHELPPLVHPARDRLIDVHHTILPPTARIAPDAAALVAGAVPLRDGLFVLSPEDMVVHAALHLLADGDLAGGLRNLFDIDRLLREFADADEDFWLKLTARVAEHGAGAPVARAARLAHALFGTPVPGEWRAPAPGDGVFRRRLLARDDWGREDRAATRLAFYVRSHAIRMPPALLARHLAIKGWKRWRGRRGKDRARS